LAGTGVVSARLGESDARRATLRVVAGGLIAMAVTYAIGSLVGIQVA
jgi:VIT1/CCC1 family predicted Fe2+/Mn2+ transporter